ncbi:MAG: hydroxymethylbilane synthase [Verrucomicrobiota bacterium]
MSENIDKGPALILGSRGSDLAVTQVRQTEARLLEAGQAQVAVRIIQTVGDKRPDLKLSEFSDPAAFGGEAIVDKGIFTKELEEALLAGEIHAAVHSLKDVPTELHQDFIITASLEREQIEDVLLSRNANEPYSVETLPQSGTVATSSVRRARQLSWLRPDLKLVDIRGNVPTRIHKLIADPQWDAIMLARAGLKRLGFLDNDEPCGQLNFDSDTPVGFCVLDAGEFLPAAGQGAIGIESRHADASTNEALALINHQPTFARVNAERAFLARLQAGCQTPVGLYTWWSADDSVLNMKTRIFDEENLDAPPREGEVSAAASGTPEDLADQLMQKIYGN